MLVGQVQVIKVCDEARKLVEDHVLVFFEFCLVLFILSLENSFEGLTRCLLDPLETKSLFLLLLYLLLTLASSYCIINFKLHGVLDALAPI